MLEKRASVIYSFLSNTFYVQTNAQDRRENWFWFNSMERYTDRELIHMAKRALTFIHNDMLNLLLPMCAPGAFLKYGQQYNTLEDSTGTKIPSIPGPFRIAWNRNPFIQWLNAGSAFVAGTYDTLIPGISDGRVPCWDYSILFFNHKIAYIQLARLTQTERLHRISTVSKDVYCLYESDILYLEVFQNHLHWHYRNQVIESLGTLSGTAEFLSEDFVRIHRCYIVNKNHVENIRRCGAKRCALTMDNGDEIPIPYNKFVSCKNKLTRPAGTIPLSAPLMLD